MIKKTEGYKMGDKVFNTLPELELARKYEVVSTYTTTDGKTFKYESDAKAHEARQVPHRLELSDLMNKIVILVNNNQDKLDAGYLNNVKTYIEKVINSEYEAQNYEDQYHNSNCY